MVQNENEHVYIIYQVEKKCHTDRFQMKLSVPELYVQNSSTLVKVRVVK